MHHARSIAALLMMALVAACGDREEVLAPGAVRRAMDGPTTALVVEADLPIARLLVTIDDPLGVREVELRRDEAGGPLAGAIELAPGAAAKLAFRAYDDEGDVTHEGEGTIETGKEVTPQREVALEPQPGADAAAVRVGTYRLAMTPAMIEGKPGGEYVMEAALLDAKGGRHAMPKGLEWRPAEPDRDVGKVQFEPRDLDIEIRFAMARWFEGAMRVCEPETGTCGYFWLFDWRSPVITVGAGNQHSCALRSSGIVSCWGSNASGQLGRDSAGIGWLSPHTFVALSVGYHHNCGIDAAATVRCWGQNYSGQLGVGMATTSSVRPVAVAGLPAGARMVAAGGFHTCALLVTGETWCWGDNYEGQLGDGSRLATPSRFGSSTPVRVAGGLTFVAIEAGHDHTCGLTASGEAWCWGVNTYGQIGISRSASDLCWRDGLTYYRCAATPRRVETTLRFADISAGSIATCARTGTGVGYCWGEAVLGYPVASGTWHEPNMPLAQPAWQQLVVGNRVHCGIDTAGMVQCFGNNLYGQTGTGSTASSVSTATPVALAGSWTDVDVGAAHACGVRSAGLVISCWGNNSAGQVGSVTPGGYTRVPLNVTARY